MFLLDSCGSQRSAAPKIMKLSNLTRRDFTKLNTASLGMLSAGIGPAWAMADSAPQNASLLVDVDFKALISRSNLHYLSPVEKSVEGQPIGNGRMGTMVWTTPSAIHFQINRSDVFAVNRNHVGKESFPRFTDQDTVDVCGACAQITLDVGFVSLRTGLVSSIAVSLVAVFLLQYYFVPLFSPPRRRTLSLSWQA